MVNHKSLVDCVSVVCPDILSKTLKQLAKVERGRTVEVICNTRSQANQVMEGVKLQGHKVVGMGQDLMGITRVLVEKIH